MFMAPFTGPISGSIERLSLGSVEMLARTAGAMGSSQDTANTIAGFAHMPGWVIAALFSNFGL